MVSFKVQMMNKPTNWYTHINTIFFPELVRDSSRVVYFVCVWWHRSISIINDLTRLWSNRSYKIYIPYLLYVRRGTIISIHPLYELIPPICLCVHWGVRKTKQNMPSRCRQTMPESLYHKSTTTVVVILLFLLLLGTHAVINRATIWRRDCDNVC